MIRYITQNTCSEDQLQWTSSQSSLWWHPSLCAYFECQFLSADDVVVWQYLGRNTQLSLEFQNISSICLRKAIVFLKPKIVKEQLFYCRASALLIFLFSLLFQTNMDLLEILRMKLWECVDNLCIWKAKVQKLNNDLVLTVIDLEKKGNKKPKFYMLLIWPHALYLSQIFWQNFLYFSMTAISFHFQAGLFVIVATTNLLMSHLDCILSCLNYLYITRSLNGLRQSKREGDSDWLCFFYTTLSRCRIQCISAWESRDVSKGTSALLKAQGSEVLF